MKKPLSNRFWILTLSAAFLCFALWALLMGRAKEARTVARIEVGGELVREIDLAAVTEEFRFTVDTPHGSNLIAVRPGGICVLEADCPDRVCVRRGWLTGGRMPIVCLPHGLSIALVAGEETLDAVSG